MANRIPITLRLDSFEGPIDLLLFLIQSNQLDISKVSISKITDQYLSYILLMRELNFDTSSEFLVMAATLLHWKSKALLPKTNEADANANPDDADGFSQDDLVRQLIEHQRFLAAGESLAQLPQLGEDVFTRNNQKPPIERIWKTMDVTSLTLNYQDMLIRARKRNHVLKKETISLTDKIVEFGDKLQAGKLTDLRNLMPAIFSKPECVVTFLASLELARIRKLKLYQEEIYGSILVELLEKFDSTFLLNLENLQGVSGFMNAFDSKKPVQSQNIEHTVEHTIEHTEPRQELMPGQEMTQ